MESLGGRSGRALLASLGWGQGGGGWILWSVRQVMMGTMMGATRSTSYVLETKLSAFYLMITVHPRTI